MNDKHHKLISDSAIDMYESLRISIEQAGGHIPKEELMNMTVDELISSLCTNNVRFAYVEPKYKGEYKQDVKLTDKEILFTERKLLKEIEHHKKTIQIQSQTINELKDYKGEVENATAVAKSIVNYLYKNCFYNKFEGGEDFEPFSELEVLLSQISNMVTGVTNKEKAQKTIDLLYAAEQENKKLKNCIFNIERKMKGDIQ